MYWNCATFLVLDYEEDIFRSFNSGSIGSGSNVNFGERKMLVNFCCYLAYKKRVMFNFVQGFSG